MFRILILFLIFYLLYKFIKKTFFPDNRSKSFKKEQINGEKIVPCDSCNVYIPESKSIKLYGKNFCSKECVNKYNRNENKN